MTKKLVVGLKYPKNGELNFENKITVVIAMTRLRGNQSSVVSSESFFKFELNIYWILGAYEYFCFMIYINIYLGDLTNISA